MPCIQVGLFVVNMGNPTETVTMRTGRVLKVEWGDYFGPAVVTRSGLRCLTNAEFQDPNVDAWIVGHGAQSCLKPIGPLFPKPRKRKPETGDISKPPKVKIVHKVAAIDREGQSSALCYSRPRAVDLSREGVTLYQDDAVTCQACRAIMAKAGK